MLQHTYPQGCSDNYNLAARTHNLSLLVYRLSLCAHRLFTVSGVLSLFLYLSLSLPPSRPTFSPLYK
jgi:hypothetical protein